MKFTRENIYVIVEDYFNSPDRYVLTEEKSDKANELINNLDLSDFEGKGTRVFLCRYLGTADWTKEDENYELILTVEKTNHSFEVTKFLGEFPLIEGNFKPGIYRDWNLEDFYELKTVEDISELYSRTLDSGLELDEFKLVCKEKEIELVFFQNGSEEVIETIPAYPFSYFDFYCPICDKKVVTYETSPNDEMSCVIKKNKCKHFIGLAEKENGNYIKESLKRLEISYKFEGGELFLLTSSGWRKPIVLEPPVEPLSSYWGASGGENFTDVFLFMKSVSKE